MEWRDEGIILSVRRHGETAAIAGTALWMGMQGDWFG